MNLCPQCHGDHIGLHGLWLAHARLVTARGIVEGAVGIARGRIAAIRARAPGKAERLDLRGNYLAAGFIDLHVWGDSDRVAREAVRHGTTAFLTTLGPEPPPRLVARLAQLAKASEARGAWRLGAHLEGPFLSRQRAGALPTRWMRPPTAGELTALERIGGVQLLTIAPELDGAMAAIRWCRRHRIVVSLGHSVADAPTALRAVEAGARAVTHVFNGMSPFHHRRPSLLDVALTEPRLTTMVILDGVHVSPYAFRLLLRVKGPERIALVTDSIRHQGWDVVERGGAYHTRGGVLAGSRLTMIEAVRNAVRFGASLPEAVRMATEVPAKLLGDRSRGALEVGRRADLVCFDRHFRIDLTMIGGHVVYQRTQPGPARSVGLFSPLVTRH